MSLMHAALEALDVGHDDDFLLAQIVVAQLAQIDFSWCG
jgi:hypothetical protein